MMNDAKRETRNQEGPSQSSAAPGISPPCVCDPPAYRSEFPLHWISAMKNKKPNAALIWKHLDEAGEILLEQKVATTPEARGGLEGRARDKTGEARGRRSWRWSLLGDPGSNFLVKTGKGRKKEKGEKKEGKRKKGKNREGIQTAELDRRDQVTATKSWPNSHRREGSRGR
jgi:hypothetical protein